MLLKACLWGLVCLSSSRQERFSPRQSREGKNSRLTRQWGGDGVEAGASPLHLDQVEEGAMAEMMRSIVALNEAELVKENYRQSRAEERLLEGGEDQMSLEGAGQGRQVSAAEAPEEEAAGEAAEAEEAGEAAEAGEAGEAGKGEEEEEEVRCIKKVMQVEETVWEDRIRCEHRFTEKCHDTYITDYVPTQERNCQTSFKKNCHITYKPTQFTETVELCNEGLEKVCSNTTIGEEICRTHYETTCETRFKEHVVEQDEPVCEMVTERKCRDVQVPVAGSLPGDNELTRRRRQLEEPVLSLGQECEEWPVQRCTLERKTVKKVNPDTACRKVPKEVCAPSNCQFQPAEKVCREEQQDLIQNIPSESCSLEPQEDCRMETVLVPRLVLQPNCIKVPKEVCVAARVNPRKVKKPVVKEWCYKPSDLRNPGSRLALSQIFAN